jgi:hypothetical protein
MADISAIFIWGLYLKNHVTTYIHVYIYGCITESTFNSGTHTGQPLTEMSTRNIQIMFLRSKAWPVLKADNLFHHLGADCLIIRDPQHLTTIKTSMACYRDSFTLFLHMGGCETCVISFHEPLNALCSQQSALLSCISRIYAVRFH